MNAIIIKICLHPLNLYYPYSLMKKGTDKHNTVSLSLSKAVCNLAEDIYNHPGFDRLSLTTL
jgi:hypothetical protein